MKHKENPTENIDIKKVNLLVENVGKLLLSLQGSVSHVLKDDGSPVSDADYQANDMLQEALKVITPDIPLISEEFSEEDNKKAAKSFVRWVADPLDGTRSFLHGREGFGCHLALIIGDTPFLGFASFPSADPEKSRLYFTGDDGKAYKKLGNNSPIQISVANLSKEKPVAAIGWRDNIKRIFDTKIEPYPAVGGGRMCLCAEGEVDIALFEGHFSDWDLAAAHAILRASGGELYNKNTGEPIRYTSDDFIVPPSIAGHHDTIKKVILPSPKLYRNSFPKR